MAVGTGVRHNSNRRRHDPMEHSTSPPPSARTPVPARAHVALAACLCGLAAILWWLALRPMDRPDGRMRALPPIRAAWPTRFEAPPVSLVELPGSPIDIELVGGTLYAALATEGLVALDVRDPLAPAPFFRLEGLVDHEDKEGWIVVGTHAEASGSRLYVFDRRKGITLLDVSDPFRPVPLWTRRLEGGFSDQAIDLTCSEGWCYLACGGAGLRSSPESELAEGSPPAVLAHFDHTRAATFFGPDRLLVADGFDTGMRVLDVSDPRRPRLVHTFATGQYCDDILPLGRHAILSNRSFGFLVLDMTDPDRPFVANHFSEGYRSEVKCAAIWRDRYLLTGNTRGEVDAFDMHDPARPEWVGRLLCPSEVRAMVVSGDLLHVALWRPGGVGALAIHRLELPGERPAPEPSGPASRRGE